MTFCILCECEFEGHGNNPEPLAPFSYGVCCDDCNKKVIEARISQLARKGKIEDCEHEINIIDENWKGINQVFVTAECSLCKIKFEGMLNEKN